MLMQFKDMLRRQNQMGPAERPAPGKSIIIAENEPGARAILCTQVSELGYVPLLAETGAAVVQMAREYLPRLVIVSIELDGPDVLASLREDKQTRQTPVMLISNSLQTPDAVLGTQLGAGDYICKPIDGPQVKTRIRDLLLRTDLPVKDSEDILEPMLRSHAPQRPYSPSDRPPELIPPADLTRRRGQIERAEMLYAKCCQFAQDAMARAVKMEPPDIESCRALATQLVHECETNNRLLLKAIRPYDPGVIEHDAPNVAIFSIQIGRGLNYDAEELTALAMTALCHEVGMACVPTDVTGTEGKYSKTQWAKIQQHPEHAYKILSALGEKYHWLAEAVYQEHERERGQGYPRQLKGGQITEFAKIIGLADTYESLSHPRTFRKAFIAFDALREIIGMRSTFFAPHIIRALVSEVSVFPLESYVLLNTGETARVARTSTDNLLRPVVVVEYDSSGQKLKRPKLVDLASKPLLYVTKPLDERELPRQSSEEESSP